MNGHHGLTAEIKGGQMVDYDPLREYLLTRTTGKNDISLSFSQIEGILGESLPQSARKYRAWWANQTDTSTRPQAKAWIDASFRVRSIRQSDTGGSVTFERATFQAKRGGSNRSSVRLVPGYSREEHSEHVPNRAVKSTGVVQCFNEFEFNFLGYIEPERDDHGEVREFRPQNRYTNSQKLALHGFGAGPFCRFRVPIKESAVGVYILTIDDEIVYIGECANLQSRFGSTGYGAIQPRNCFHGGQSTNCKINHAILTQAKRGKEIKLWFHKSADRKTVEERLIKLYQPPWNTQLKL
ncbi:GIY-YIG nuclease family protein [Acidobacteria bacterium AH-259-D05]|nr:GIY-YIG nuclease family protein [Acidobacteria bacterium AH-259-D05]